MRSDVMKNQTESLSKQIVIYFSRGSCSKWNGIGVCRQLTWIVLVEWSALQHHLIQQESWPLR